MAKKDTVPVEGQGASDGQAGAEAGKEAKTRKRSQSKYVLCKQLPKAEGDAGSRFEVVLAGTSAAQLEKDAATMDDGRYAIMAQKRVIEVEIKTAKTVRRIK